MKKFKIILSALLSAAVLSASLPVSAASLPFSDVPEDIWYYEAVKNAYETKLFAGTGEGKFSPGQSMTRAMFVQVLANKTQNYNPDDFTTSGFSDVPDDAWFAAPVAWASKNGLVSGTGDGKFSPMQEITREQMAAILYKYAAITENSRQHEPARTQGFHDRHNISAWAEDALAWAVTNDVMAGDDRGNLNPIASALRCEVAQVFFNARTALLKDTVTGSLPAQGITLEQAKEIALAHAGFTAPQVRFTVTKPDWENGRQVYEIEFYVDRTEYEYEIDALSGKVLSFERD